MKKTCVVTGGAGFLGSHLCDRLLREGFAVICIDNLLTGERGEHLAPRWGTRGSASSSTM